MRILVVEDEPALRSQLESQLTAAGYVVDAAKDGEEGLYYGREYGYEAAVIDLGLPKLDGRALIGALRKGDCAYPILILTARGHWRDKVAGLEAGADDYLTKPFQMEELLARLNALIRRAAGYASPLIQAGPVSLDTGKKEVRVNGETVDLTAFEYRVLECLMLNAGRVVSKAELTDQLYAQDYDRDSNVIEVFVGRLRKKLEPASPIRTLRGQGYKFAAEAQ